VADIHRQEIMQDIRLFTDTPKAKFYDALFLHLKLDAVVKAVAATGNPGYPKAALLCAFIVMKCEGFGYITDLVDYLTNNLLIAHFCGFDITRPLPSYWTFDRFLKQLDNGILQEIMQTQVLELAALGIIDTSFLGEDSTPVKANTRQNNPKAFHKDKFKPDNQPAADSDCRLGVQTASNQHNEKNFEFFWGYKNHVLSDSISGLPVCELTTAANVKDHMVALDMLARTHDFLPITECSFLADKAFDVKAIYNTVRDTYQGECFIPLNPRNTKDPKKLHDGVPLCEAALPMRRDGTFSDRNRTRQKFCCPFKRSKTDCCPCNHKNWNNGRKNCGCTKYITIPNDYRLSIDRTSIYFKSVYALRTECERYNSRFKATGQERLWVRNQNSAANLNTLAHICLLAIALAAVVTAADVSYRCIKSLKRIA